MALKLCENLIEVYFSYLNPSDYLSSVSGMILPPEESMRTKTEHMIVKIPVYFEVKGSYHPDEVAEMIARVRVSFTKNAIKVFGSKITFTFGRNTEGIEFKLLKDSEVQNLIANAPHK
jgi:hypothetical protein